MKIHIPPCGLVTMLSGPCGLIPTGCNSQDIPTIEMEAVGGVETPWGATERRMAASFFIKQELVFSVNEI